MECEQRVEDCQGAIRRAKRLLGLAYVAEDLPFRDFGVFVDTLGRELA